MTRTKARKKETYYDRWMKGKRKMTIILREEEYNAIKQFCDANRISYREFFVSVAPRLLKEAEALRQALAERESQLSDTVSKYNDLVAKYNDLVQRYKALKGDYERLTGEYERLRNEHAKALSENRALTGELTSTRSKLQEAEARAKRTEEELSKAKEELAKTKEVLQILLSGHVEVDERYCEKLRPYGFALVQKGFMKKTVCTNSGL